MSAKEMIESGGLVSVSSRYVFPRSPDDDVVSEGVTIPTIDFSLLVSGTPDQRSKAIRDLGDACLEWGFFVVINHGVPTELLKEMERVCKSFHDLTEEEKREYAGKQLFDPIRVGTSFNVEVDDAPLFWRDYLKIHVHPHFHAPSKPLGFREICEEYCKRAREVASALIIGISQSLGVEENYIHKATGMENESVEGSESENHHHQLLVVNMYRPCPEPEKVMGLPPHSDHGLLTLLTDNHISGLQVRHNARWVPVISPPYSFIVNVGDHMEILTNGRYKSVVHRALVNNKETRVSMGTAHGPPLDNVVAPAPEFIDSDGRAAYRAIKYRDYLELQQSMRLDDKSCLNTIRIESSDP